MCLCLIPTWHLRVLGTPLNSSEYRALNSLFEEFSVPVAGTQIWDPASQENHTRSESCHLLHSAAPEGTKQDLRQHGLCSLCQNPLSKEYIPQHHSDTGTLPSSAKTPQQLLLALLWGDSIVTVLLLGCSHCACSEHLFPPSLLSCHSLASWERLCAPPLPSVLIRMIFSQPPLFLSIFKPDFYLRLISV